jgi:hypothetical protein
MRAPRVESPRFPALSWAASPGARGRDAEIAGFAQRDSPQKDRAVMGIVAAKAVSAENPVGAPPRAPPAPDMQ